VDQKISKDICIDQTPSLIAALIYRRFDFLGGDCSAASFTGFGNLPCRRPSAAIASGATQRLRD
jgi:hypothetical protein